MNNLKNSKFSNLASYLMAFLVFVLASLYLSYQNTSQAESLCQESRIIKVSLPKQIWLENIFLDDFCYQGINYNFKLQSLEPGLYQILTRDSLQKEKTSADIFIVEPYLFDELDLNKVTAVDFLEDTSDDSIVADLEKLDDKIKNNIISSNKKTYLLPFLIDIPIVISKDEAPPKEWQDYIEIMQTDIENPKYFFVMPIAKGVVATKTLQMFSNAFGGTFYTKEGLVDYISFKPAVKQILKLVDLSWQNQKTAIADDLIGGLIQERFQNILVFSSDLAEYKLKYDKKDQLSDFSGLFFEAPPSHDDKLISMFEVWSLALAKNSQNIKAKTIIALLIDRQDIIEKAALSIFKDHNGDNSSRYAAMERSYESSSEPIRQKNFRFLVRKEIGLVFEAVIDRYQDPWYIIEQLQSEVNKVISEQN